MPQNNYLTPAESNQKMQSMMKRSITSPSGPKEAKMGDKMKVIVGFSGGVSSAWCAGWALRNFDKKDVVFLFHDTKEEHPDTYRFIKEMSEALEHPITERRDGRSVTELFYDHNALANNRMAFCSQELKAAQRDKYFKELRKSGEVEIINVLGFSANESNRVQRTSARAEHDGYKIRFPMIEDGITKQQAADWCKWLGVQPSAMYHWSEHANCIGCVRGGKAYWLAVWRNHPEIYRQREDLEIEFQHTFLKDMSLLNLRRIGLKRSVCQREAIEIGPCECGD
jgi:3'-phosphoadenosine 5'-phosphosulfate sulfotransferase (PAPS reductase)/FAD synthetase